MPSEWDMPEPRLPDPASARTGGTSASRRPSPASAERSDGLFSPLAFFGFIFGNIIKIGLITAVITAACFVLFNMVPFSYKATATVLVDPRSRQVTQEEDVLSSIGSDAAILESMVQILKSDGFLLTVMKEIGVDGEKWSTLSETEQLEMLAKFKRNLTVERKGATYLVEVTYKAPTAKEAAAIANSVATSFADTQNGYLREATEGAGRALSERLIELRQKLNTSEQAVADYAAEHGILYVDANSTLQTRQLAEVSAQLAAAKTATEEARARYQQQAIDGDASALSSGRNGEPAQLTYLRQQRTQLLQTLEQQSLTYGPRHPRIAETRRLIEGIERQIRDERKLLVRQLKGAVDVAETQQRKLEEDIARLSSGVMLTDAEEVKLEALRREAAADRDIYEKFLSRNKATDELAELKSENVKVVSPAVPPLRSTRPSMLLVLPIIGLFGGAVATTLTAAMTRPRRASAAPVASDIGPVAETVDAGQPPAAEPVGPLHPQPARLTAIPAQPARRRPAGTSLLMLEKSLREDARRATAEPFGKPIPLRPAR